MVYIGAWIVVLPILALFVLLFSVRVFVNMELTDTLTLNIRVFGIKIRILPKKEKKYKLRKYTKKKIAKRDAKAAKKAAKAEAKKEAKRKKKKAKKAEKDRLTKAEKKALKKKNKEKRPAIPDMISLFIEIAKLFFSTFLSHFHIKTKRIHIKVGGSDAAQTALMWYGIYAACGGLLVFLDKHSNLHGRKQADILIVPDYLSDKIETDLKLSFSMNLFGLLCVLFKVGFKFLFGWIKILPAPKQSPAEGHKVS